MFLKRIFSRPKPQKQEIERLSLDALSERLSGTRKKKVEYFARQLKPLFDEIAGRSKTLLDSLRELSSSEPSEDVHPSLLKSATEARKLLVDKINRAISDLGRCSDFSSEDLLNFDERIYKTVNLTTDAMRTHGRYVSLVYGQKSLAVETGVRELHELFMRTRTAIKVAIDRVQSIDSVISEIDAITRLRREAKEIQDHVESEKSRVVEVESLLKDDKEKLTKLRASEEFKLAADSINKVELIKKEINQARDLAVSRISEMSRPFRKLDKLIASGVHSTGKETIKILRLCVNSPVEVIDSDENIARLETLLRETSELISTGKIDLEDRERTKKLSVAQGLTSELRGIRKKIESLGKQLEHQQGLSQNTILMQAAEIEKLIGRHEQELKLIHSSIGELGKRAKDLDGEIISKGESLKKLASTALGAQVEITS